MAEKEVVILEHVPSEKAGTILDFLKKEKIPYREVRLFEKKFKLPSLEKIRALVVMGGPMNVYEERKFPFLKAENMFIQKAVRAGIPYLGICLGSQLLAKALGAKVYKARKPEVGWDDVRLLPVCKKDPVFGGLDFDSLRVLQWHEDTFDLPKGSVRLASSGIVPNQAYACRKKFYGLQFHVEVNRPMLEDWFKKHPRKTAILREYGSYRKNLGKITGNLYRRFFGLVA